MKSFIIFVATDLEFRAIAGLLKGFRRFPNGPFGGSGGFQGTRIDLYKTEMGPRNAARITQTVLKQNPAKTVLVTGLAGALTDDCRVGEVVLYDRCGFGETSFPLIQTTPALVDVFRETFQSGKIPFQVGTGLTARRLLWQASEKKEWGRQYSAKAIDMESYQITRFAHQAGKQIVVFRVISDDAHHDVPDFNQAMDKTYQVHNFRVFLEFARHPIRAARFLRNVRLSVKRLQQAFAVAFTSRI